MKKLFYLAAVMLGMNAALSTRAIAQHDSIKIMEQVFYTQQGNPYVIKSATKTVEYTVPPASFYQERPRAFVNRVDLAQIIDTMPDNIGINTSSKIVPLMMVCAWVDTNTSNIEVDQTSPYYSMQRGGGSDAAYMPSLSKIIPLIDRVYYTSPAEYQYNLRYGQIVLNDIDFMDAGSGMLLWFHDQQAWAVVNGLNQLAPNVPEGVYTVTTMFIYFEMQDLQGQQRF